MIRGVIGVVGAASRRAQIPRPPQASRPFGNLRTAWAHQDSARGNRLMHRPDLLLLAASLAFVACGDPPRSEMEAAGSSASASATAASSAETGTASDPDDDDDDSGETDSAGVTSSPADESSGSGGVKLDVGHDTDQGPGSGDPESDECTNVDLLFVIDDSGSMADNQEQLVASFPGFVAGIQEQLGFAESYHIGVVTTSNYTNNPPACYRHGDLVTQTVGAPESSNAVCNPFTSGSSFIDETEPDLAAKFGCIAQVGGGGDDDEKPITSLLNALSPGNNATGGCNDGFFRLDSLLVVVIISDEDDVLEECLPDEFPCFPNGTEGTPQEWHDAVLAYKGYIPQNVVVLSLIGTQAGNPCNATPASRLMSFTNAFGSNGHIGDVCAASYDQFFVDVLPLIDEACENYVEPEG